MPVDGQVVLFCSSLEQVASNPDFVPSALCTLREDLEFPLSCGNFCVDPFNIQTSLQAQVETPLQDAAASLRSLGEESPRPTDATASKETPRA